MPPAAWWDTLPCAPLAARADRVPVGRPGYRRRADGAGAAGGGTAGPAQPGPAASAGGARGRDGRPRGGLQRVLDRGGYVAGSEREFYGRTAVFNLVTERVLRFGSGTGASAYLRWLRAHAAELLGEPRSVAAAGIGTDGFRFRPRGCGCHSDTPTYLIAWRRGGLVLTVLASGNGASPKTTGVLARSLDRAAS